MSTVIALIIAIVVGFTATSCNTYTEPQENVKSYEMSLSEIEALDEWFTCIACEDFGLEPWEINIYYTDELSYEQLTTRKERGEIIVERIVGIILDDTYNGRILTTADDYYNYISYRGIGFNAELGDFVVTYCLYNPETDYEDDIFRYDYPISTWESED